MPRIPEFPEHLDERQQAIADRIRSGPRGRIRGPLAMWLYSPDLAERAQHLGEFLRFGTAFDKRLSELAIITVARHHACGYIWSIHAPIAVDAGVPPEAVEAIRAGDEPSFEDETMRSVHRFVTALLAENRVPENDFGAIRDRFGERGIVELTGIMGYYALGCHLLNATEIPPPTGTNPF
jgi:4-carboxymuconolactone decarboxylase